MLWSIKKSEGFVREEYLMIILRYFFFVLHKKYVVVLQLSMHGNSNDYSHVFIERIGKYTR